MLQNVRLSHQHSKSEKHSKSETVKHQMYYPGMDMKIERGFSFDTEFSQRNF